MRKFNVLLVDDEEIALNGIEKGVDWDLVHVDKVYKCHNKDTAIRMLQTYNMDFLITDIEMPGGSGLELLKWVRENNKHIPAIFYTGYAEFSYVQEALRLGATDYLLKPIRYKELEKVILKAEEKVMIQDKKVELNARLDDMVIEDTGSLVEQVKNYILTNLSSELQRDELASVVHISAGHLSRIFKEEEGISLSDYIINKRIAMAKQLLSRTAIPITSVASKVGISYASYFTKIFKKYTGLTPQEYRAEHRK